MDPDANVSEQLGLAHEIIQEMNSLPDATTREDAEAIAYRVADKANRLAELVIALDDWIQKGGFLTKRWQPEEKP